MVPELDGGHRPKLVDQKQGQVKKNDAGIFSNLFLNYVFQNKIKALLFKMFKDQDFSRGAHCKPDLSHTTLVGIHRLDVDGTD